MKRNTKLDKANSYRLSQEVLRNKALTKGVNLIAPETIFLSKDTSFGKNVVVEPTFHITDEIESIDIDTEFDFMVAEHVYRSLNA